MFAFYDTALHSIQPGRELYLASFYQTGSSAHVFIRPFARLRKGELRAGSGLSLACPRPDAERHEEH